MQVKEKWFSGGESLRLPEAPWLCLECVVSLSQEFSVFLFHIFLLLTMGRPTPHTCAGKAVVSGHQEEACWVLFCKRCTSKPHSLGHVLPALKTQI